MPDIDITGEIGWEVEQTEVAAQFKALDPEKDIQISLSTNGGSVFQGVKIGHLIRDHKGKTTVTVSAAALSMGSHILQNADVRKVHDDTAFMMHNPWMMTAGDHIELQKDVNLLKSLAGMLSTVFAKKSGQPKAEISTLMDAETWLFGQEIVDAGFADEVIETEDPQSREDAIIFAKLQFKECLAKLKVFEGAFDDHKKIAAMLRTGPAASTDPPKPAKVPVKPTPTQGETMNETEFLAFLETNPAAKAFYTGAMAYIKDVAEASTGPDLTALSLPDILALAPQAQTEQTQAITDAQTAVAGADIVAHAAKVKKITNVLKSDAYDKKRKSVAVRALADEITIDAFDTIIAMYDSDLEELASASASEEQPADTPPGGADMGDESSINSPKHQANISNLKDRLNLSPTPA